MTPPVIGRKITVNSSPREVVGAMPKDFQHRCAEPDLIAPIAFNRSTLRLPGFGILRRVYRLKPTVTIAEASRRGADGALSDAFVVCGARRGRLDLRNVADHAGLTSRSRRRSLATVACALELFGADWHRAARRV